MNETGVFVTLALLLAIGITIIFVQNRRIKVMHNIIGHWRSTYLRKQGSTLLPDSKENDYLNYDLRSLDGGRTWYAVKREEDGSVIILGEAEQVYPGLLQDIDGLDKLLKFVEEHGTITLTGKNVPAQIEVLENAGFSVRVK